MEREFCKEKLSMKIESEYLQYVNKMMRKSPREIYDNAYQIEKIECIYRYMQEILCSLSLVCIQKMYTCDGLLFLLYEEWLKLDDDCEEQLKKCIQNEIINSFK